MNKDIIFINYLLNIGWAIDITVYEIQNNGTLKEIRQANYIIAVIVEEPG